MIRYCDLIFHYFVLHSLLFPHVYVCMVKLQVLNYLLNYCMLYRGENSVSRESLLKGQSQEQLASNHALQSSTHSLDHLPSYSRAQEYREQCKNVMHTVRKEIKCSGETEILHYTTRITHSS